jgi:hypothetical protein
MWLANGGCQDEPVQGDFHAGSFLNYNSRTEI